MKKDLERLLAKHCAPKIVEALACACLKQAKRANRANRLDQSAMWQCNQVELSMTANSLYYPQYID